ncbi:MAG: CusA/CzcA family heavy metal efflux RND transporter [Chromatiales bacterium]|nr:CusA/CzcA family heavy metal efflux RND transporter [Chromatiales bacterium]PLX55447.1 MAG: CusA/CzcA family heavy metal efflux RND transporter [Chromatiales bacterium]
MINAILEWSVRNRTMVLTLAVLLAAWSFYAVRNTPVDAIPDLSDVQVIIKTHYPGQAPQVVEDQVTYPLTTALLSVPGATSVRGYSYFGDSYVYVLFEDGTDLYWARSRVLESLSQVEGILPAEARPVLGPDATGVGWIYQYALVDRSGRHDLAELRSIQDWFLKFELQTVPGVAEVATVGGMVRQYQIVLDVSRIRAYGLPLDRIVRAVRDGNQEVGGSVIELAEAEYMIRGTGYLRSIADIEKIPVGLTGQGTPILLRDVASVRLGPQMRRGIADLDGEGEVVGGIVVMRWGENARSTIAAVQQRLDELKPSLPPGVEIVVTYDRSNLIDRAVSTLNTKLLQELAMVLLVCVVFLGHFRSGLVAVIALPLGVLAAYSVMYFQGINANIMSLGGIAIAIGVMVDAAIVMVENLHKHIEEAGPDADRWELVLASSREVGKPIFFSLLITTVSFLPVFTLEAQEGRLFAPLAYTKTYAMAAAAILAVTLVPVLMGFLVRGRIRTERDNPLNRALMNVFGYPVRLALRFPRSILLLALLLVVATAWPWQRLGAEFMPELDEGDLFYMPTTLPGISAGKAAELLQQTDRLIRTVPEVERVFGKVGRAETATDPAPLTMIETMIRLKPRKEWRPGLTLADLKRELDEVVRFPGLTNSWVMPIKTRIDMLATGIKTPVGIKIAGPDLAVIQEIGQNIEAVVRTVPGTRTVYSERVSGGRYIDITTDRAAAARYGMDVADIQRVVATAIGGMTLTQTIEGLERYPVNIRYPRDLRDSVENLRELPVIIDSGAAVPLGELARIAISDGPPMIKSENARPNGWVYVDLDSDDLRDYVERARAAVSANVELPAGYSIAWSGQYEYWLRAAERLRLLVPFTLMIIVILLAMNFRSLAEVLIILGSLPLALIGGVWLVYLLGYNMSVAVGVGFIGLAGLAVEIGVVMLVYLNAAYLRISEKNPGGVSLGDLHEAIFEGVQRRIRPILMTVIATMVGLTPIMLGGGAGSEVMRRIAAPMVGGLTSALLLAVTVIPALYLIWRSRQITTARAEAKAGKGGDAI